MLLSQLTHCHVEHDVLVAGSQLQAFLVVINRLLKVVSVVARHSPHPVSILDEGVNLNAARGIGLGTAIVIE